MKIKILVIIGRLDIGGTEKHLLNIFPYLGDNYDITIFPLKSGGLLFEEFRMNDLNIVQNRKSNRRLDMILTIADMFVFCLKNKPDIIHFFLPPAYLIGMFVSFFSLKSKKIMSRRSLNNYQEKNKILKYIEYKLHKYVDFVIGNSMAIKVQLIDEDIDESKIGIIYNGINIPDKHSLNEKINIRKKYNVNKDTIVFIVVANLIPYKGHKDLLKSLFLIKDKMPENWCVFMVGRNNMMKKEMELLVEKYQLIKNIKWVGEIVEPDDYYKISDIGILSSHQEGFSNSLLEGMSYSLAMLATDVGGNSEAIVDGVSGLITPSNCPEKMSLKILTLVNNVGLRIKLGEAARKRVCDLFNKNKCIDLYRKLYSSVHKKNSLPKEITLCLSSES